LEIKEAGPVRRFFTFVILIALVMRAAIPAGFMLAPSAPGDAVTMVICTGAGPKSVHFDGTGAPIEPEQSIAGDACAYTPLAAFPVTDLPPDTMTSIAWAEVIYRLVRRQFSETPVPSAWSARGPPAVLA
jgi:hypothetical protein